LHIDGKKAERKVRLFSVAFVESYEVISKVTAKDSCNVTKKAVFEV
jgi:hypothetical protein